MRMDTYGQTCRVLQKIYLFTLTACGIQSYYNYELIINHVCEACYWLDMMLLWLANKKWLSYYSRKVLKYCEQVKYIWEVADNKEKNSVTIFYS